MASTKTEIDTKEQILKHLEDDRRPLKYLSDISGIPYGTIYGIFVQNTLELTKERLAIINRALGTKFKI